MNNNQDFEKGLMNAFANRELTEEERTRRYLNLEEYLIQKGGIILAVSCKDGIFLAGMDPDGDKNIFQVFDRIALLGIGRAKDCRRLHGLALGLAYSIDFKLSAADISSKRIAGQLTDEIDESFSYLKARQGIYKANFILADLGFKIEEDFLELITFCGSNRLKGMPSEPYFKLYEAPIVRDVVLVKENKKSGKRKNEGRKDKKDNKNKPAEKLKGEIQRIYFFQFSDLFFDLIKIVHKKGRDNIWNVKEAAFLVGSLLRLVKTEEGLPEMVYLDRNMLKKTELGGRRFHHIWQRITNPDPYKPSDPWQDWKKFVAPVRRRVKKGEIYPEFKGLVELMDAFNEGKIEEKEKELLKKIGKEDSIKLFKGIMTHNKKEIKIRSKK